MLQIEQIANNILKIRISGKLEENDFKTLAFRADQLAENSKLLIDATGFDGWSDMQAVRQHFAFVRDHQHKIKCIALIAGHAWQHWVAGIASVFVHPIIRVFDKDDAAEAQAWLRAD